MVKNRLNDIYILDSIIVGDMSTNCYLFGSAKTRHVVIIDPGADFYRIKATIDKKGLVPEFIINTHGHIDHIGANAEFGLPIFIHADDADFLTNPVKSLSLFYGNSLVSPKASRLLQHDDAIEVSDISLKVIHTPGHTPGSISLYHDGLVFSGDTLFESGIGRTDFPYGDHKKIVSSIKDRLMLLDDHTIVLPGHGDKTTIGKERNCNSWI